MEARTFCWAVGLMPTTTFTLKTSRSTKSSVPHFVNVFFGGGCTPFCHPPKYYYVYKQTRCKTTTILTNQRTINHSTTRNNKENNQLTNQPTNQPTKKSQVGKTFSHIYMQYLYLANRQFCAINTWYVPIPGILFTRIFVYSYQVLILIVQGIYNNNTRNNNTR